MSSIRDNKKEITAILQNYSENTKFEALLKSCAAESGKDAWLFELLIQKYRLAKLSEIIEAKETWFQALGWWLGKMFIWFAFCVGITVVSFYGKEAADPATFMLFGASAYYAAIQIFFPSRIKKEKLSLADILNNEKKNQSPEASDKSDQ
ncbi:MAG: hypothetical protein HQM10_19410 [Candidatus Riflebacteria bacterium]|nr:hypothetical protein [Candidatus Riflebacteria bacterium]